MKYCDGHYILLFLLQYSFCLSVFLFSFFLGYLFSTFQLRRRLTGVSTNTFEDLTSSGKVSSDYYTHEEMLKFKKPKKKKSLRKKDKLDINALEAEAVSSGLGVGDLGSRSNVRRQAIKEEQERLESKIRSNAYQSAYAKAEEASKLLRQEQTFNVKTEEDETPAFVDDDEDLRKSLEKARRLALKKHEEDGVSGPQAIALLATSNHNNETDGQNPTAGESRENKVVFTEMEEFVWGLHIDEGNSDLFVVSNIMNFILLHEYD